MDCHLGLDLEASREYGIGLDEGEVERAVSGHDIGDVRIEQAVDGTADQPVAEVVEGPLVLLEVGGGEPVADDHVVAVEHLGHHGGCRVGRVGVVAVGHDVHVRVDVLEHGPDHVALALAGLAANDGALGCGDLGGAVGGVVVVHVDGRIRQGVLEVAHHLADGDLLVVAGEEYGNGGIIICFRHIYNYNGSTGLRYMSVIAKLRLKCCTNTWEAAIDVGSMYVGVRNMKLTRKAVA